MSGTQHYKICPQCARSVSVDSPEQFCAMDGNRLLEHCPRCAAAVSVPGARFCAACGFEYRTGSSAATTQAGARPASPGPTATGPAPASGAGSRPLLERRGRAAAILSVLVIAGVVATALFTRPGVPAGRFVGQIEGTPLFVGVTAQNGAVIAYVCDGRRTGEWFRGKVGSDGEIALRSSSGGRLTARIASDGVHGQLELPGSAPYAVDTVPATGSAGLYRAERRDASTDAVAGWVLLASANQRGVVTVNKQSSPAPRLDPSQKRISIPQVGELEVGLAVPGSQ